MVAMMVATYLLSGIGFTIWAARNGSYLRDSLESEDGLAVLGYVLAGLALWPLLLLAVLVVWLSRV